MDYGKLVDKQLVNVMRKTSSLQKPLIFHLRKNESFDFGTGQATAEVDRDLPIRGLVVETKQRKENKTMTVLIQRIADLDQYDEATFQSETWKINSIVLDNGFTQMVELTHG